MLTCQWRGEIRSRVFYRFIGHERRCNWLYSLLATELRTANEKQKYSDSSFSDSCVAREPTHTHTHIIEQDDETRNHRRRPTQLTRSVDRFNFIYSFRFDHLVYLLRGFIVLTLEKSGMSARSRPNQILRSHFCGGTSVASKNEFFIRARANRVPRTTWILIRANIIKWSEWIEGIFIFVLVICHYDCCSCWFSTKITGVHNAKKTRKMNRIRGM